MPGGRAAGRASLTPTNAALLVLLSWPVVGHEVLFQTFREGKRQGDRAVNCRSVNTGAELLLGHYSLNNLWQYLTSPGFHVSLVKSEG